MMVVAAPALMPVQAPLINPPVRQASGWRGRPLQPPTTKPLTRLRDRRGTWWNRVSTAKAAREAQAAASCASRIRVRSLRGVIGSASTLTPSGRSASSIAEQIAGGAPMRPPSPPPLMPYSV